MGDSTVVLKNVLLLVGSSEAGKELPTTCKGTVSCGSGRLGAPAFRFGGGPSGREGTEEQ
jgi:hypothetical protein